MDDGDKEYIHNCANPIIIHLCQSGLEHLRLSVKRCRAACLVLAEHKAMNIVYNLEQELDNNYDTGDINMSLSSKQDTCQRQRQRVTDMINIARVTGETQFTSTNIRNFYATLAPGSVPFNCYHRRTRKRPRRLIEEHHDDNVPTRY